MGSCVLETWTDWIGMGVKVPMLIVGLGGLLIGAVLPWLTAGVGTDRRIRGALVLGGALVCGVALWPMAKAGGLKEPAVQEVRLDHAACVKTLSQRMAELTVTARLAAIDTTAGPAPADPIGLVSGSSTGMYHAVADDLVAVARRNELALFNRETLGSLDNFRKLVDPKENAAIGFVQSDLLDWLRNSPDREDQRNATLLRLVLPLYAEEVHVLARSGLNTLADLAGRRVLTAASSQGSGYTAENLLRAAQVSPPARFDNQQTMAEALCSVLTGRADAVVIVQGKPSSNLLSLDALLTHPARPLDGVHLMPLDLPAQAEGYEVARIDASDYPWVQAPVTTLSVRALLMAVDFSSQRNDYQKRRCQQLKGLGDMVKRELPVLSRPPYQAKWREVDPLRPVRGWRPVTCSRTGV